MRPEGLRKPTCVVVEFGHGAVLFTLRQVAKALADGFSAWKKGIRRRPRFKGWFKSPIRSLCFDPARIEDGQFYFGRFLTGTARVWRDKLPDEKVSFGRLVQLPSGRWQVQLVVSREAAQPTHAAPGSITGVDVRLNGDVVISTGQVLSIPASTKRKLARVIKRRKFLQRKAARGKRKSRRGLRMKTRIAKLFEKERGIRDHYQWVVATYCAEIAETVVHEGFDPRKMQAGCGKRFSGKIHAISWAELWTKMGQACAKRGGQALEAPASFPSSKLCHECGTKNATLTISEKQWICPSCGAPHDRDLNAAVNLENFGRRKLAETAAGKATEKNAEFGQSEPLKLVAIPRSISLETVKRICALQGVSIQMVDDPLSATNRPAEALVA